MHAVLLSKDGMWTVLSEVRSSDLMREQGRTGRVSAPEGAAVAVDGAGAAAGKPAAVSKVEQIGKENNTQSSLDQIRAESIGIHQ